MSKNTNNKKKNKYHVRYHLQKDLTNNKKSLTKKEDFDKIIEALFKVPPTPKKGK